MKYIWISFLVFLSMIGLKVHAQDLQFSPFNWDLIAEKDRPGIEMNKQKSDNEVKRFVSLLTQYSNSKDESLWIPANNRLLEMVLGDDISFFNFVSLRDDNLRNTLASITDKYNNNMGISFNVPVYLGDTAIPDFEMDGSKLQFGAQNLDEASSIISITGLSDIIRFYKVDCSLPNNHVEQLHILYSIVHGKIVGLLSSAKKGGEYLAFTQAIHAFMSGYFEESSKAAQFVVDGSVIMLKKTMSCLLLLIYYVEGDYDMALNYAEQIDPFFVSFIQLQSASVNADMEQAVSLIEEMKKSPFYHKFYNDRIEMSYGLALAVLEREDEAKRVIKPLLSSDDPSIQASLGFMIHEHPEYFSWLADDMGYNLVKKAADSGDLNGQIFMSVIEEYRDNDELAKKWIVNPARQGNSWAVARLGFHYHNEKKYEYSLYCFEKALELEGFDEVNGYFQGDYWPESLDQVSTYAIGLKADGIVPKVPAEFADFESTVEESTKPLTENNQVSSQPSSRNPEIPASKELDNLLNLSAQGDPVAMARAGLSLLYGLNGRLNFYVADSLLNESLQSGDLMSLIDRSKKEWPQDEAQVVEVINALNLAKLRVSKVLNALSLAEADEFPACLNLLEEESNAGNGLAAAWLARLIVEFDEVTAPDGKARELLQLAIQDRMLPMYVGYTGGELWPSGPTVLQEYLQSISSGSHSKESLTNPFVFTNGLRIDKKGMVIKQF